MWWNPFYEIRVTDDAVIILNQLTNQRKFIIESANASKFMDAIFRPLMDEDVNVADFLNQFPPAMKENVQNLIGNLDKILLKEKKEKVFYEHLFTLIQRIKEEFPGLDTERITKYMEETIGLGSAVILYDAKQYDAREMLDLFPFQNIKAIALHEMDRSSLKQSVANMREKDWLILLTEPLENEILRDLDQEIVEKNRIVFFSENDPDSEKIYLGPILIPRCTGGLNQILDHKYLKKTAPFRPGLEIEDKQKIKSEWISNYMYDEILKFTVDKYSNYATEYSKLLGVQYELDYEKKEIQRKEFIIL